MEIDNEEEGREENVLEPQRTVELMDERDPYAILQSFPLEEVKRHFDELYNQWFPSHRDPQQLAIERFGFESISQLTEDQVEKRFSRAWIEALTVIKELYRHNITRDNIVIMKMNKILEQINWSRRLLMYITRMLLNFNPNYDSQLDDSVCLDRFSTVNPDVTNNYQSLLLFLLERSRQQKLAKYGKNLYEMRLSREGDFTYSWKYKCSIRWFILKETKKSQNFEQWQNLTSPGSGVGRAEEYLIESTDEEIPFLEKDRHVFSFRNGVYLADKQRFHLYKDGRLYPAPVAAKYFDMDFNPEWTTCEDWRDIPTPYIDRILSYQEFDQEEGVLDIYWGFKGRNIYWLGELKEDIQAAKFNKGMANSGKSMDIFISSNMYEEDDVGTWQNDAQQTFGTNNLYDFANSRPKFFWTNPEIRMDTKMDQSAFQSIISGSDPVTITFKGKDSFKVPRWTSPGEIAGNELPGFSDNSGSISRRLVVFEFKKTVIQEDPQLKQNIFETEMAAFICKANRAYHELVQRLQGKGLWNVLPAYFTETRNMVQSSTNALYGFLCSENIFISKGDDPDPTQNPVYIPERHFKHAFFQYCDSIGYKRPRWNYDYYNGPFQLYGLFLAKKKDRYYPRSERKKFQGTIIFGCDLANEFSTN